MNLAQKILGRPNGSNRWHQSLGMRIVRSTCWNPGSEEAECRTAIVDDEQFSRMADLSPRRPRCDHSCGNFIWMLLERCLRLSAGLVLTILIARHLGPEDFGRLSYAIAFCSIFAVAAAGGTDDLITRDIARAGSRNEAVKTAAAGWRLRIYSSISAFVATVGCAWFWKPDDVFAWRAVVLVASGLCYIPWDVIYSWFQARGDVGPATRARLIAFVVAVTVRLGLLFIHAGAMAFAAAIAIESLLNVLCLSWVARRDPILRLRAAVAGERVMRMMREGVPLLISSLLVIVALQGDRLLLVRWKGEAVAGVYAAGIRFSETLYVVPQVLGTALMPRLAMAPTGAGADSRLLMRRIVLGWVLVAGGVALLLTLVAAPLIPWLFGPRYGSSTHVLAVHAWSLVFVGLVSIRSRVLVAAARGRTVMLLSAFTAATSLFMNGLLIPNFGAVGSAWAAVITWGLSALILPWMFPSVRTVLRRWLIGPPGSRWTGSNFRPDLR